MVLLKGASDVDRQFERAISQLLLRRGVALFPGFDFAFFCRVSLKKPIQLRWITPTAVKRIKPGFADRQIEHNRVSPSGQLNNQSRYGGIEESCCAMVWWRQSQLAACGFHGDRVFDLRADLDNM